jgi:transposase
LERRLAQLVAACGCTLTDEVGIGVVSAARLLVEVGDPARFRSEAAFNRWWGGAPVAVSSGEGHDAPARHRLDLLGNRRINSVIHVMSITQARCHQGAKTYLAAKRADGKTSKEARRAHKTLLGRRIIRRMWADRRRQLDTTTPAHTHAA